MNYGPTMMSGNKSEPERLVGDYRLRERLSDDGQKATWLAEQVTVGRDVILEELLDLTDEGRENFFTDTRARAAVDHPFIASVYEAVNSEGHCFRASERLLGETLESMLNAGATMEPERMAHMLRCIAEANLHHETNARATDPLKSRDVHVDSGGVTRLRNLAVAGHRGDGESARDAQRLGAELAPLVPDGRPGATRMLTVLAWMRGKGVPAPLRWLEIVGLCDQIDRQLSAPIHTAASVAATNESKLAHRGFLMLFGFTAMALFAIAMIAWLIRPTNFVPVAGHHLAPVLIPAGEYPTPAGGVVAHPAFLIDARETTIGEYREFLETLAVLAAENIPHRFGHPAQPDEKNSHEPDDWPALLAAARARGVWNEKTVSLDSPVPGVDWWDAFAYANWRKARLPTEDEWFAALHHECVEPAAIPVAPWRAFMDSDCADRTPAGILCMAGSLSEWTQSKSINPANPLGRPQHVIVGGSHLKPASNALTRELATDAGLRRVDLGFRVVRDIAIAD